MICLVQRMVHLLKLRALAKAGVFCFRGGRGGDGLERLRFVVRADETTSFGFTDLDDDVDFVCGVNFELVRMG